MSPSTNVEKSHNGLHCSRDVKRGGANCSLYPQQSDLHHTSPQAKTTTAPPRSRNTNKERLRSHIKYSSAKIGIKRCSRIHCGCAEGTLRPATLRLPFRITEFLSNSHIWIYFRYPSFGACDEQFLTDLGIIEGDLLRASRDPHKSPTRGHRLLTRPFKRHDSCTSKGDKMSNSHVGNVYQQIIADVVESSRVDFEEGGVDDHVLEELKQVW